MSDTLQFVVVMREGLAKMLNVTHETRRQTEVCRTFRATLPNLQLTGVLLHLFAGVFQRVEGNYI